MREPGSSFWWQRAVQPAPPREPTFEEQVHVATLRAKAEVEKQRQEKLRERFAQAQAIEDAEERAEALQNLDWHVNPQLYRSIHK